MFVNTLLPRALALEHLPLLSLPPSVVYPLLHSFAPVKSPITLVGTFGYHHCLDLASINRWHRYMERRNHVSEILSTVAQEHEHLAIVLVHWSIIFLDYNSNSVSGKSKSTTVEIVVVCGMCLMVI